MTVSSTARQLQKRILALRKLSFVTFIEFLEISKRKLRFAVSFTCVASAAFGLVASWLDFSRASAFVLFGMFLGFLGLELILLILTIENRRVRTSKNPPPSLKSITNFADFWGLGLRKRIKATAGDFDVEVKRLHKEKRFRMAKWNVILAWGYAIWYVMRGPYDLVKGALVKALKGL